MKAKHLGRFVFAGMALILGSLAVQPVKADDITDPTIEMGVATSTTITTGSETTATESSLSWADSYQPGGNTNYLAFYLNDTTTTWTSVTIVVTDSGDHTYTNEAYSTSDFGNCSSCSATFTSGYFPETTSIPGPVTFTQSGGSVAPGQYLVVRYNNFPTSPDTTFAISVTGTNSQSTGTSAPEPSSIAMLGIGLLGLIGLAGLTKRRRVGLVSA